MVKEERGKWEQGRWGMSYNHLEVKWSKSRSVVSDSVTLWTILSRNSPGQNTGVGSRPLLQGIFPTQGSNPGLLHCGHILYQLSHKGKPFNHCYCNTSSLGISILLETCAWVFHILHGHRRLWIVRLDGRPGPFESTISSPGRKQSGLESWFSVLHLLSFGHCWKVMSCSVKGLTSVACKYWTSLVA